jgi:hypothetical protein
MEDDIGLSHFLHPICRQRVDGTSQNCKGHHDANGCVCIDDVIEVVSNSHSGKQHLSSAIFGRGHTGDLAEQIDPTSNPAKKNSFSISDL